MTDPDRLAEIRARIQAANEVSAQRLPSYVAAQIWLDLAWLISEVERMRGRLKELEWAGHDGAARACPACDQWLRDGHAPDCWLAIEIRST